MREEQQKKAQDEIRSMTLEAMDEQGIDLAIQMRAMGLPVGFGSTKGKSVPDGNVAYANIKSDRKYRQYMNRKGGFARPLEQEITKAIH